MKSSAIVLLLAVSAVALSADVTPAFATKMDGKCCQSSDGGRSWRFRRATQHPPGIPAAAGWRIQAKSPSPPTAPRPSPPDSAWSVRAPFRRHPPFPAGNSARHLDANSTPQCGVQHQRVWPCSQQRAVCDQLRRHPLQVGCKLISLGEVFREKSEPLSARTLRSVRG